MLNIKNFNDFIMESESLNEEVTPYSSTKFPVTSKAETKKFLEALSKQPYGFDFMKVVKDLENGKKYGTIKGEAPSFYKNYFWQSFPIDSGLMIRLSVLGPNGVLYEVNRIEYNKLSRYWATGVSKEDMENENRKLEDILEKKWKPLADKKKLTVFWWNLCTQPYSSTDEWIQYIKEFVKEGKGVTLAGLTLTPEIFKKYIKAKDQIERFEGQDQLAIGDLANVRSKKLFKDLVA